MTGGAAAAGGGRGGEGAAAGCSGSQGPVPPRCKTLPPCNISGIAGVRLHLQATEQLPMAASNDRPAGCPRQAGRKRGLLRAMSTATEQGNA